MNHCSKRAGILGRTTQAVGVRLFFLLIFALPIWAAPAPGPAAQIAGPSPPPPGATLGILEAVRLTLEQDPAIRIQQAQETFSRGALTETAGQFDFQADSSLARNILRLPLTDTNRLRFDQFNRPFLDPHTTLVTDETDYRLGLRKQFRYGPSISPGVTLQRIVDNEDQNFGVNRATIDFQVNIPLLKGFGPTATDAEERAARARYEASGLDLQQLIATRVLNTASAYWLCLAAEQELQILQDTEAQASNMVQATEVLIQANELAGGEIEQAKAFLAEKAGQRLVAEQQLLEARQNLGLAIGRSAQQLPLTPLPSEAFPTPPPGDAENFLARPPPIDLGLSQRADYKSALKAVQAEEILLAAAKQNLLPELDLTLGAGYSGLDQGVYFDRYFGSLASENLSGLNLQGLLLFQYPIGNHAARGVYVQHQALARQAELRREDLARTISSGIVVAISELARAIGELKKAQQSVAHYVNAVANEQQKLELGSSTVLDKITIEDRLADARLNWVAAQGRYAIALARVRYETGQLIAQRQPSQIRLSREDFLALPARLLHGPPPR